MLNWSEKISLVEEMLDEPSQILMQSRNVIIDLMLEIQALFIDTKVIESKFDKLVPAKTMAGRPSSSAVVETRFEKRFPNMHQDCEITLAAAF